MIVLTESPVASEISRAVLPFRETRSSCCINGLQDFLLSMLRSVPACASCFAASGSAFFASVALDGAEGGFVDGLPIAPDAGFGREPAVDARGNVVRLIRW